MSSANQSTYWWLSARLLSDCSSPWLQSQPLTCLSPAWFLTQESSLWGFLSVPFFQSWISWNSLSPSLCKTSKHNHQDCHQPPVPSWALEGGFSWVLCFSSASLHYWKYCFFFFSCLTFIIKHILIYQLALYLCPVQTEEQRGGLRLRALALASGLAVLLPEEYKT